MKKSFWIAVATLAVGPIVHPPFSNASEKTTECTSAGVADAGYILSIAADGKTAVLSEESIAGPRKVADMDCESLLTKNYPDYLNNYLVCRDARATQGTLIARLYTGGFVAQHYASILSTSNVRGNAVEQEVQFGRLSCR